MNVLKTVITPMDLMYVAAAVGFIWTSWMKELVMVYTIHSNVYNSHVEVLFLVAKL